MPKKLIRRCHLSDKTVLRPLELRNGLSLTAAPPAPAAALLVVATGVKGCDCLCCCFSCNSSMAGLEKHAYVGLRTEHDTACHTEDKVCAHLALPAKSARPGV